MIRPKNTEIKFLHISLSILYDTFMPFSLTDRQNINRIDALMYMKGKCTEEMRPLS